MFSQSSLIVIAICFLTGYVNPNFDVISQLFFNYVNYKEGITYSHNDQKKWNTVITLVE